ncbi:MAG: hypothetical protein LBC83_04285 [Oscillospiraceae bacterium]|jgi:Flp pilus assembly protein TadB|nr:hypothetical protein [Oscillospiraceae bacterium]
MAKDKLGKEAQERAKLAKDREKWRKEEAKRRTKKKAGVTNETGAKIIKIISIAIAAALVIALGIGLGAHAGLPQILLPAAKVGDNTIHAPEWAYYFYNAFAEQYNYAKQVNS